MLSAFSFLAASPVTTTAPVSMPSGVSPARAYVSRMKESSRSVSIRKGSRYGVKRIGD